DSLQDSLKTRPSLQVLTQHLTSLTNWKTRRKVSENSATKKHIQCMFIEKEHLGFLWFEIILYKQRLIELFGSYDILGMLCTVLVTITAIDNKYKLSHKVPGRQGWLGCFAEIFRFERHSAIAFTFQRSQPHTGLRSVSCRLFIDSSTGLGSVLHCPFEEDPPSISLGNITPTQHQFVFVFSRSFQVSRPYRPPITLQDVAQITPSIAFVLPSTRVAPPPGQLTGNWTAVQAPAPQTAPPGLYGALRASQALARIAAAERGHKATVGRLRDESFLQAIVSGITINVSAGLLQNAVQSDEHTNLAGAITLTGGATIAIAIHALYRWWQHRKEYNSLP
ncbi:hypothetical protein PROFUN_16556, partial [Planoprotostelium fungivorum]